MFFHPMFKFLQWFLFLFKKKQTTTLFVSKNALVNIGNATFELTLGSHQWRSKTCFFARLFPSKAVQDFGHQQYHTIFPGDFVVSKICSSTFRCIFQPPPVPTKVTDLRPLDWGLGIRAISLGSWLQVFPMAIFPSFPSFRVQHLRQVSRKSPFFLKPKLIR